VSAATLFAMVLLTSVVLAQTAPPVVNGNRADLGDWPDAAGIVMYSQYVGCTGTLIHPRIVLTAGHCMDGISHVVLNTVDYYQDGGEWIEVQRSIEYPNSQSTYDLGILVLAEDAETEPRLIAQDCILTDYLKDGADVAVVGYGATDYYGNQDTTKLMEGFTTIDDHDCDDSSGCNWSVSPGGELGAGGSDNVDSCFGDSGGPLYLLTDRGDFLVGATSRGYSNVSVPCRDGGIYGRPDAIWDWIEDKSGYKLPVYTCNAPPTAVDDRITIDVVEGERVQFILEAEDVDGDELTWDVAERPARGSVEFNGDQGRYQAPDGSAGTYFMTLVVSDGQDFDEMEVRIRVAEAGPLGCSSGAVGAGLALGLFGLVGARRRR